MNFHSAKHVYEAAPPYMDNREKPLSMMKTVIAEFISANADASEEVVWNHAAARVLDENKMLWFGLTRVSMEETDRLSLEIEKLYDGKDRYQAAELEVAKRIEQVKNHVKSINNLVIDDVPITDFDTFYVNAPKELVRWVCDAVHNSIILIGSERKNFLPKVILEASTPTKAVPEDTGTDMGTTGKAV